VAYGGGTNSTALLVGLWERAEKPDLILFADTGGEKPETYAHLNTMNQWLQTQGFPIITVVHKDSKYASLEDECLTKKTLPSLAFGWRSCSDKWKAEPQRKFLNHWPPAKECWKSGGRVIRAIGFGVDEMRRVKPSSEEKFENWFPLVKWKWDREKCVEAIQRAGLPLPGKSACFFCPASTKLEIAALQGSHPELYERALAMERNAADTLVTVKGLGRRFSWADVATTKEPHCVEQTCVCFDGDDE